MRTGACKFKATVLSQTRVDCPLQVGNELLPHLEEFKYVGVLITSCASSGRVQLPLGLDKELERSGTGG